MKTPPKDDWSFKRILVATDGSENAGRAAGVAIEMAKRYEAELIAMSVIPTPGNILVSVSSGAAPQRVLERYYAQARKEADRLVQEVVSMAEAQGVRARGETLDKPLSIIEGITNLAESEKVDLVVVGTRGLSGFGKLVIGSVSSGVVSHISCSVLVVR